ncbi:MAG: hypothetical protein O9972_29890, partial [Burkholderiales bacterium]|nr:hypothetical protein [Burkholderiales bacterium]
MSVFQSQLKNPSSARKGNELHCSLLGEGELLCVSHGVINVTEQSAGQTVDLGAGQSATTRGLRGLRVSGIGALFAVSVAALPIPPYSAWRGKFDAPFEHPPANCTYFLIDRSGSAEFAERPGTR